MKDSFDFNKLSKRVLENLFSHFTNVKIDETIEIIKNTFKLKSSHHLIVRNASNNSKYEGLLDGMIFEVFK